MNNEQNESFTELENILLQILTPEKWTSSEEIYDTVSKRYSQSIKKQSVLRAVRTLREKNYFVLLQRNKHSIRYKICSMNEPSRLNPFFEIGKDDILFSHSTRNSWQNIV
jgi:Fe2+ or Zn2+ uptake regulation protein